MSSASSAAEDRRWLFGPAVLDERSLELSVNGTPVELERKPLEVLLHLLRHAGEVVTKDELLAAVWPGRVLSDSALTSCTYKLREALADEQQELIKTVHGYGYRLVAPVKVETVEAEAPARFEFKPGEHLPARPLWSLIERLGTGGHGEAWLARHDKTREQRVYKFAADAEALVALKREITLYRLLHDSLGERPDFIRLLDWNLEEPPYFVEYGYLAPGSLATWAKAQGGLDKVPLATRLDIAVQVADALAAAHSVGVLHKDLKPSNVLVDLRDDGSPQVKLCDFGSGGVLDVARLEQMGITRLGFTKSIAANALTGATPLYLAPEVVSGQPFTVQADIYALGVMLYQLVAGNFHKQLATGWELDVADELLREDIAQTTDGHPERRIADAGRLAQRLRTLDERRRALAAERHAADAAQRAILEMERVRARRTWVRLAMGALAAGVIVSTTLLVDARRARNEAAQSAATSKSVTDFLSQDMFAQISSGKPLRDLTLKEVLEAASQQVPTRFKDQPAVAAQVHGALGSSFLALDEGVGAERELDAALAMAEQHDGPGSDTALEATGSLLLVKLVLGKLKDNLPHYQEVLAQGIRRLGPRDPRILKLRRQFAELRIYQGEQQAAVDELRRLLVDAAASESPDPDFLADAESQLGSALERLGEYAESEKTQRSALARLEPRLGANHIRVATTRVRLAEVHTLLGRYSEAETELAQALQAAQAWTPSDAAALVSDIHLLQGRLKLEQGHLDEAAQILEAARAAEQTWQGPELDQTYMTRFPLAQVYQRQGHLAQAEAEMRLAVKGAEALLGAQNPAAQLMHIGLADILREQHRTAQAWAELKQAKAETLAQPGKGELLRVTGLLELESQHASAARAALGEALAIFEKRYGTDNWRTQRAHRELALVPEKG